MELLWCYLVAVLAERNLKLLVDNLSCWPEEPCEKGPCGPGVCEIPLLLSLIFLIHVSWRWLQSHECMQNAEGWNAERHWYFQARGIRNKGMLETRVREIPESSLSNCECEAHMQSTMTESLRTEVWYKLQVPD